MRKIPYIIFVLVLITQAVVPAIAQEKSKISIAIVDFQNTSQNKNLDYLQNAIPEMLITNLAKSGKLDIVERSRLQDAIKEMQLGMTGVVDQNNAVELGKAVGANAILVGSYLEIGGLIRINARLIDVESSKVLKAESVQGRAGQEIFSLMDQLAQSIERQLVGEEKKPQPTNASMTEPASQRTPQKPATKQPTVQPQKKGGSHTALYVLGGAALVGGGVAAAVLLSKKKDENNNSTVAVTVNIPQ